MKQFCKHGHDTQVAGRRANGSCRACAKLQGAAWYQKNKEQSWAQSQAWAKNNPAARRRIVRKSRGIVGLPAVEAKQGDPCDVCGEPMRDTPCADHDHGPSKAFRGWVCDRCNLGLEHLDRPGWQTKANAYLVRARPIG